ncbi:vWA domain-containing protein [Cryptosporangium aurantiacum]|uniref:Predicted metal-dependent peptidase n=1 Tax=Cryptosporangium aurantiacum TaxID=134849 RepID=A0A1M7RPQ5_9ACTN|nr:VWA-like domain-containing protein [Cryptosporangium aurantiacum]SHN48076.1 Predicted metal-dependent peptidase [Cryptosporangium aurantiacum]
MDETKLLAARHRAATARPYLASALYAMAVVADPSVHTMAVDRWWRCYAAPAFVAATPIEELAGVWLHEVSHLLRDHHGRADRLAANPTAGVPTAGVPTAGVPTAGNPTARDRRAAEALRLNLAMDCEINDDLITDDDSVADDGIRLPDGAVTPQRLRLPQGLLFEEYAARLPRTLLHGRLVWTECGSGAHGVPAPWELGPDGADPLSGAAAAAVRHRVAEQIRRGRGSVPLGWRRWATGGGPARVDWRRVLRTAIGGGLRHVGGQADYSFRRPGRRGAALAGTVVLPGLVAPAPAVAIVVDTSGSVSDEELGLALAETTGIIKAAGASGGRIRVYSCDATTQTAQNVCAAEQVTLRGGGGTDMRSGIRRALADAPRPDVVVVLTDGHTPWPAAPPPCRVVAGLFGPAPEERTRNRPPEWIETVSITDG